MATWVVVVDATCGCGDLVVSTPVVVVVGFVDVVVAVVVGGGIEQSLG